MKRVAGRQTRYVNKLEKRTGSLWEGRFKSSIVSKKEYLAAYCRYIELNPLRAGLVTHPGKYQWTSYGCRGEGKKDLVVDLDSSYLALGKNKNKGRQHMLNMFLALCLIMNSSSSANHCNVVN